MTDLGLCNVLLHCITDICHAKHRRRLQKNTDLSHINVMGQQNMAIRNFARWVGGSSDDVVGEKSKNPCKNQKHVLEMEKGQTVDSIPVLQKRRLCADTLSKQGFRQLGFFRYVDFTLLYDLHILLLAAILQELVEENQENSETSSDLGDIFLRAVVTALTRRLL